MKRFLALAFTVAVVATFSLVGSTTSAQADDMVPQVDYCGSCCDLNPYTGAPRIRCGLVSPWVCGGGCICAGIPGSGFACY